MLTTLIMIFAALAAAASVLAVALPLLARDRRASRIKAVSNRRRELSDRQKADLEQARGSGRRRGGKPQRRVAVMRAVIDRLKLQDLLEAKALGIHPTS